MRVYCVLAKAAEGEYTQGRLAELAWMDKTTMVVTLDEMERARAGRAAPAPGDRRVRVIAITAAGSRGARPRRTRSCRTLYDELLAGVAPGERETFLAVLRRAGRRAAGRAVPPGEARAPAPAAQRA